MTYNSDINKKCAYATNDTADEKVCSPPGAKVHQCCVHAVKILSMLNECAALENPLFYERYSREHIKYDDYDTQECAL